ncbi:MAG: beta strand repeat-containing protein, partial [Acidobacteriota bacterium]
NLANGTNVDIQGDSGTDTVTINVIDNPTFAGLITANGNISLQNGDTITINGDAFDDLTGNGLTISSGDLSLGTLTANWNQTGAFDVVLNNAGSELQILESNGATFFGTLDVGDLSGHETYTFLQGGTVITTGNIASNATTGVTAGSGLTGGGTVGALTLDIGAGNGVTVNANDIAVIYGSAANTAVQGNTSITVTAGTNLTGGGSITLGAGGSVTVNVSDNPTFAGDVVIQGGGLTVGKAAQPATLDLHDGDGETIALALPDVSASYTLTLPTAVGSANQCLKAQNGTGTLFWDNCLGGAGAGITSIDGQTGPSVSINNATGAGNVITIDNAVADGATKGIAAFNATNFSASSGVINTIQGISTAASPQFVGLTLTGDLQVDGNTTLGNASSDTLA